MAGVNHSNRFSKYSLISLVGAAVAVLLATRSFQNGDSYSLTNAPYLMAPIRFLASLNPFKSPPPPYPVFKRVAFFEFSESETMLLLVYLALITTALAFVFGLKARARREPSELWALTLIPAVLVGFQTVRLLYWISLRWGV
jgi:hypothetical protein